MMSSTGFTKRYKEKHCKYKDDRFTQHDELPSCYPLVAEMDEEMVLLPVKDNPRAI